MSNNTSSNNNPSGIVRKRPPKLSPIITSGSPNNYFGQSSLGSATSNDSSCDLDSTTEVSVGEQKNILITPDSLIVKQQLGRGQYGIVERVYHGQLNCDFAVKRVPLRPSDEKEKNRLLKDVDILKATKCKNIIKFYGALIWEGDLWIIMELMDCSLDKFYKLAHYKKSPTINNSAKVTQPPCTHLRETETKIGECSLCNPISEKVLGRMASDINEALGYLYSIKVIHRDIKPSNILINKIGIIKLCDFGISGYLVNSVAQTFEAGCRPYMAPERIDPPRDSSGYNIKSDVWSFGITMLEIATGQYPYQHALDFFRQVTSICVDPPPRLPVGRWSQDFEFFIENCLRKEHHTRPKYDALKSFPFIANNKEQDISKFTEQVISLSS